MHNMKKRWNIAEFCPSDFLCGSEIHPIFPHLLWHRGIREQKEVEDFFSPSFSEHVHDPFLFRDMRIAVDRVLKALETGEKILVFGDYDADGLTGSTVVISTLAEVHRCAGFSAPLQVESYIPHRDKEGYGLQMRQVQPFIDQGVNLVITVDCGIACVVEIEALAKGGVETIVIDHHQFGETLPNALRIHPGLPYETYPFKSLAAVGVAWKFACALVFVAREKGIAVPEGFEKWLLDLVAIATITDIVPLVGENRVLEHFGLIVLNRTRRPGLRALIRSAGLTLGMITPRDIGFAIGPRLNAPSRMDHASVGLELLLSETDEEASVLASRIESLNRARQEATLQMMCEADVLLETFSPEAKLHVLWRDDWSPALVGLVAGRVSDRFGVPVIAIGKHGGQWIGSGRSFPWYDITDAARRSGEGLLTRVGGHIQACGFALAEDDDVVTFAQRLRADAETIISSDLAGPALEIHAEVKLSDVNWGLLDGLNRLQPFGCGNPDPVFVTKNVQVVTSQTVGKDGKHLRFVVRSSEGSSLPFIAFGFGSRVSEVPQGARIDIAYGVSPTEWNGRREIQCKVVDFRSSDGGGD